jgi:hypothetical protein
MVWFTGWSFRKSHLITGAVGAVANYPVAIKVYKTTGTDGTEVLTSGNTAGKIYVGSNCRDDFGDIRFTEDDGETELKYWQGTTVSGTSAIFWVKVTDDLSSNAIIYVYYKKDDATTTSDFDNTFVFGDDFHDTSLDTARWTSLTGNPTYSIVAGAAGYLEVTNIDSGWYADGKGFHSKALTLPTQWIIEDAYDANANGVYLYEVTTVVGELQVGMFCLLHKDWATDDYGVIFVDVGDWWAATQQTSYHAGVGGAKDYDGPIAGGASIAIYTKAYKLSGNITIKIDGVTRVNAEANSEVPIEVLLWATKHVSYVFGTQRFGPFKIRPYCATEPAHSTWGTEEEISPKSSGSIVALMREMELI